MAKTPQLKKLPRATKISVNILTGKETLERGHQLAGQLWNDTQSRLKAERAKGRAYPGRWNLQKAMRPDWRVLSDRVFSYVILDAHTAWRAWLTQRANGEAANPPAATKNPRPLVFEVRRNTTPIGEWTYRLTVLGQHIEDRHATVKLQVRPGLKMAQVKLVRLDPAGETGSLIYYAAPEPPPGEAIAGVDLGIINLAVVAFDSGESILYSGKGLLSSDRYYHKRAQKCKPSNWQPGEKRAAHSQRRRDYRRKAGNIRRMAIHNLTRHPFGKLRTSLIEQCVQRGVGTLVIGDLSRIREGKNFGKATNQKLHAWPFGQLTGVGVAAALPGQTGRQ